MEIGTRRASWALVGFLTAGLVPAVSQAYLTGDYTYSKTNCGTDPSGWITWEWTITCKVTDGAALAGRAFEFQTAVEFVPIRGAAKVATATIINADGTVVVLAPSDAAAKKAEDQFGLLTPSHEWAGFQSPPMPIPAGRGSRGATFDVRYQVCSTTDPLGAGWFADDTDDLYGAHVKPAYAVFGSLGFDSQGACIDARVRDNCAGLTGQERADCVHQQARACQQQNP